jgi:hypothetical protein
MTVALTTPVTGGAQTGFTTPTYTIVADNPPNASTGKQWNVTAVSGAGNTPRLHAISDPFTVTFERPGLLKTLSGLISGVTGLYGTVPENVYTGCRVRKGVNIAANNIPRVMVLDFRARVPAGGDAFNPTDVRAGLSLFIGSLNQTSAGLGDTLTTGTL